jgi:site-specific recombinase XerD
MLVRTYEKCQDLNRVTEFREEKVIGSQADMAAYARQSKAESTRRAYASDWADFAGWCQGQGRAAMPTEAETVALYVTALAGKRKVATIQRRIAAISQAHQFAGHESPTGHVVVRTVMAGIRRAKGTAQIGKRPILTDDLRALIAEVPDTATGQRDRALLLLGFAGGFRRSELVGLNLADLNFTRDGLVVTLRRSKTDQEAQGREVGIPYGSNPATCPVRAVRAWGEALGESDGPLFRPINRHRQVLNRRLTDKSVALVVKRWAEAAGIESSRVAGHSLRAGLATSAAAAGVPERAIMAQTGHRSVTTLRKYIRSGSLFLENAAAWVGL